MRISALTRPGLCATAALYAAATLAAAAPAAPPTAEPESSDGIQVQVYCQNGKVVQVLVGVVEPGVWLLSLDCPPVAEAPAPKQAPPAPRVRKSFTQPSI